MTVASYVNSLCPPQGKQTFSATLKNSTMMYLDKPTLFLVLGIKSRVLIIPGQDSHLHRHLKLPHDCCLKISIFLHLVLLQITLHSRVLSCSLGWSQTYNLPDSNTGMCILPATFILLSLHLKSHKFSRCKQEKPFYWRQGLTMDW